MEFVEHISDYRSIAIVGLEKNTGKTECLNYILRRIKNSASLFALTSIGIDGENRDQVCQTPKPEIVVPEGMIFVTSEKHFREKRLVAEILEITEERTALGRLVIAKSQTAGKVLLSGPADTAYVGRWSFVSFEFSFSCSDGSDDFSDRGSRFRKYSGIGAENPLCV